jgi:serine/threonine-protein kinase
MSPEQCRGIGVDHRTDIYAFGVMTHRVLTGQMPFDGESLMDIMMAHINTAPPKLSQFGFPTALDVPLAKMLAKDPNQRFQTLGEAVDALEAASKGVGWDASKLPPRVTSPATTNVAQVVTDLNMSAPNERAGSSRTWIVALGALAMVAIAGGAFVLFTSKEKPQPPVTAQSAAPAPSPSAAPTPTPTPVVEPPPPPPPMASTKVTFDTTPKGAEIWIGDQKLGTSSQPVPLPAELGLMDITVKAPGYAPKVLKVNPKESTSVKVTLAKEPAVGPKQPKLSKDLENPF